MKGSLRVEEPVHTSWSRFCTVNHRASASNYQLSHMKCPARDSNWRPQRFEASTLTTTQPSPLEYLEGSCKIGQSRFNCVFFEYIADVSLI